MRRLGLVFATPLFALFAASASVVPAHAADAASAARNPSLAQSSIGGLVLPADHKRYCRGYRCYYCKYRRCDYGDCRYSGCYWRGGGGGDGYRRGRRSRGGYY